MCSGRSRRLWNTLFYDLWSENLQILAEDQIIAGEGRAGAVKEEYRTDNVLEVLFRKAVTAAKRVKTEVTFSPG